jgi:hypothetical protein
MSLNTAMNGGGSSGAFGSMTLNGTTASAPAPAPAPSTGSAGTLPVTAPAGIGDSSALSAEKLDLKTLQWKNALTNYQQAQQFTVEGQQQRWKAFWMDFLTSRIGVAAVAGVSSFLLLWLLNPPMIQYKHEENWIDGGTDWQKLLSWSAAASILAFFLPSLW